MNDEELSAYSAALDEVYRLRLIVAMFADHTEADLGYRTYPKSRRPIVEHRVDDLRLAARGESSRVLAGKDLYRVRQSLKRAGAPETLTRAAWEQSLGTDA